MMQASFQQEESFVELEQRLNLKKWDEDENEIRNFLTKLRQDLEKSFIQSRLERGVKEDELQQEFEFAIQEILNKEQQLGLSLELAYVLLEKMHEHRETYQDEFIILSKQKEDIEREIEFKDQYCGEYQRRLQYLTEQNSIISKELSVLEDQNQQLRARSNELEQELIQSQQHIRVVQQVNQDDTNSKLSAITKELERFKTYNNQLTQEVSEVKKRIQSEIQQSQECFNVIDDLRRQLVISQKQCDNISRQSLEYQLRLQGVQDEKDNLEIELINFQKNIIIKEQNERDSYPQQNHPISSNSPVHTTQRSGSEAVKDEGSKKIKQSGALKQELKETFKNQRDKGQSDDDTFDFNRDSQIEDKYSNKNKRIKFSKFLIKEKDAKKSFGSVSPSSIGGEPLTIEDERFSMTDRYSSVEEAKPNYNDPKKQKESPILVEDNNYLAVKSLGDEGLFKSENNTPSQKTEKQQVKLLHLKIQEEEDEEEEKKNLDNIQIKSEFDENQDQNDVPEQEGQVKDYQNQIFLNSKHESDQNIAMEMNKFNEISENTLMLLTPVKTKNGSLLESNSINNTAQQQKPNKRKNQLTVLTEEEFSAKVSKNSSEIETFKPIFSNELKNREPSRTVISDFYPSSIQNGDLQNQDDYPQKQYQSSVTYQRQNSQFSEDQMNTMSAIYFAQKVAKSSPSGKKYSHRKTLFMESMKIYKKAHWGDSKPSSVSVNHFNENLTARVYRCIDCQKILAGSICVPHSLPSSTTNAANRNQNQNFKRMNSEFSNDNQGTQSLFLDRTLKQFKSGLYTSNNNIQSLRNFSVQQVSQLDILDTQETPKNTIQVNFSKDNDEGTDGFPYCQEIDSYKNQDFNHEVSRRLEEEQIESIKFRNQSVECNSEMLAGSSQQNKNKLQDSPDFLRRITNSTQKIFNLRKDPYEEFFTLLAQCAKLNSEYFDYIICLDVQPLFEKAKSMNIPYNKWNDFITESYNTSGKVLFEKNKQNRRYKINLQAGNSQNGQIGSQILSNKVSQLI